jgi:MoxR-like ATPase
MSDAHTITSTAAKAAIRRCFEVKRPVFLWGPPGIGKSELVESIAKSGEFGKTHLIDLRMPLLEPTDLRGIPYYNKEISMMDWAPPVDLPSAADAAQYDTIILFLDEMNAAAPAVQASGYQLILNRKVGKYTLPDNVVIVAAGNREGDKGVTYRMPSPLANRFVHLEMKVDFASWFDWAVDSNVDARVIGYLQNNKSELFQFDPSTASRAFATPRAWSFVSDIIADDLDDQTALNLLSGTVGDGTAIKFMAFQRVAGTMPKPDDILDGRVVKADNIDVSAMVSLNISLCYDLKERLNSIGATDEWYEMSDRFLKFAMDNFEPEIAVMAGRIALVNFKLPLSPGKNKSFKEFHTRFGKHILR